MKNFFLALIPVFVAVDAIGVLPLYIGLTKSLNKHQRKAVLIQSMITAVTVAVVFVFLGKLIFRALGITISDFMVAGGLVLFGIAMMDLLVPGKSRVASVNSGEIGAVPLGTPLIVGPGVLTTCLIIVDQYGIPATITSVIINVAFAGGLFLFSGAVIKALGKTGTGALSKIMALLLAAIAVMMIRKGLGG